MTTLNDMDDRRRDLQDGFERHVYSEMEYVLGGQGIVKVKGTGTEDEEAHMMNFGGLGGNFSRDTEMEVMLTSGGSDTSLKFAQWDVPRNKKRPWQADSNGVQYFNDPDRAIEINKKRTHVIDKAIAFGPNGEIEIRDGKVYIRAPVEMSNTLTAQTLRTANPVHMPSTAAPVGPNVPNFEA